MKYARVLFAAAILASLAVAAALRFPRLDLRPMHADEANQACKTGRLYESGQYEYDVTDHHGPSLYWLTLPSLAISGAKDLAGSSVAEYRVVPALFGLALVGLLLLLTDGLGRTAVAAAALLTAFSPAMVYYSRYYIQEMLLVFFTMAAIGCGWRYFRSGRLPWLLAAGAAIGMMHATKETWVLSAAAAVGAAGTTWILFRAASRGKSSRHVPHAVRPAAIGAGDVSTFDVSGGRHAERACYYVLAALVACAVAFAFFSMFGKNWTAPWDSIKAYANYFHRGSEQGEHSEAWYYYLQILFAFRPSKQFFWSEAFIAALALVGAGHSLFGIVKPQAGSPRLRVFLTFYTLFLVVLYSAISYKTPWCALSFLTGMILLAGIGAAVLLRAFPTWPAKALIAFALAVGAGHLAWQAYRLNFDPSFVADPRNPYVYAHTPMRLPRLCERLDRLRQGLSQQRHLTIHVVVKENYWPLPWYLRKFKPDDVSYWLDPDEWQQALKHCPRPDVLILSADEDSPALTARFGGYNGQMIESLRPGVFVRIYVRNDLLDCFLSSFDGT